MNLLLIWLVQEAYGFSFQPYSRSGYVKPSVKHSKQCLIQLPTKYLYRDCDGNLSGPAMYNESEKKIILWPRKKQYGKGYYYETSMGAKNLTQRIGVDGRPPDWEIQFFFIPSNAFIAKIKNPDTNSYTFSYLPERIIAIDGLSLSVPYCPGQLFGTESSKIIYIWADNVANQLQTLYYIDRRSGNQSSFYYSLRGKSIEFKKVIISEQGGVGDVIFVGFSDKMEHTCLYQMSVSDLNDMVKQGKIPSASLEPQFCGNLSFEGEGEFMIETLSVKYPYNLTGYLLRQMFAKRDDSIVYFIFLSMPNNDHKITKTGECSEQNRSLENRDIFCKFNEKNLDHYTTVMDDILIKRIDEETEKLIPYSTCYLFNDCYGCRLMFDNFSCSWRTNHCISSKRRRESFKSCIKVTHIDSDKTGVMLTLEGVRLTNNFMFIQLVDISREDVYEATSISDYQVSFPVSNDTRMNSDFILKIGNSDIKVKNLVELSVDFRNEEKPDDSLSNILKLVVIWVFSIILFILVVWMFVLLSQRDASPEIRANKRNSLSSLHRKLPSSSGSKEGSTSEDQSKSTLTTSEHGRLSHSISGKVLYKKKLVNWQN
ncbi:uncharacterized protein LOC141851306 [Brevipalpus obovatus]|uniref:uncharacterized protein LOC141851306 n=1 Tax=Brevipalpus obovatus TaxID=246614 RepID=UPI003D9DDC4B